MIDRPNKIELKLTAAGIGSKIIVNGVELTGVTSIKVSAGVREATKLTVEMVAFDGIYITGGVQDIETIRHPGRPG